MLEALAALPVAAALRASPWLYPLVNAAHILGIGLLLGAIATLDLRLLGAFGRAPLGLLGPPLVRVAGTGLALALATGVLLFTVRAVEYAANPAFLAKLGLLALGLLNLAALHLNPAWRRALAGGPVAAPLRAGAALSLLLWVGTLLAGRWIAFVG